MEQAYNHHVSVMLDEVIEYANLKKNSKVLDMTLGRAGRSSEFLKRIPEGFLYGVDQDKEALTFSEERLSKIGTNFKTIDSNFANFSSANSYNAFINVSASYLLTTYFAVGIDESF